MEVKMIGGRDCQLGFCKQGMPNKLFRCLQQFKADIWIPLTEIHCNLGDFIQDAGRGTSIFCWQLHPGKRPLASSERCCPNASPLLCMPLLRGCRSDKPRAPRAAGCSWHRAVANNPFLLVLPSGKLTWRTGKSPFFRRKSSIKMYKRPISVAMLNYQKVYLSTSGELGVWVLLQCQDLMKWNITMGHPEFHTTLDQQTR